MVRRVVSADGTALAAAEAGDPDAPTVVCVHGYPDNRSLWDPVVTELADDHHVVAYDVRGAGESDKPTAGSAYHLDRLAEDLAAVVDAVSPRRPVHLLAHDWGAVQAWHAVTGDAMRGRITSYTSISGPSLEHSGAWLRSRLCANPRALRELLAQLAHSGYIAFFRLPLLPELAWRSGLLARLMRRLDSSARPPEYSDARHGLALYRENMLGRLSRPRPRQAEIPVQVLAPTRDAFVSVPLQTDIARWVPDLRVRRIPAGHWLPRTRPELVARCTGELVGHTEGGAESRGLRVARAAASATETFAGQLVVITGAGGGIGRATALAFAARGAELVLTDIDDAALARTAELAREHGVTVVVSVVDVSDPAAIHDFAQRVLAERGAPDVLVNNAGIGVAGPFTRTGQADWERVVDVNLWGVIHGCRAFAAPMIRRGEGGRIVNIASAAAYIPSKVLPAYSATKSAVLTLSECLRAELAADGIGVSAVCPGLVDTGITASTRFVGTDDEEQHRLSQRARRLYRRRGYPPERVAARILRAVERDSAVVPATTEATVGLWLSRVTPGLLRSAARRVDPTA